MSDTATRVTARRAGTGQNDPGCTFDSLDTAAKPIYEAGAWSETTDCFSGTDADWIWYSTEEKAVPESDDYYVLNNEYGDVVEFERTFDIDGSPVGGTLSIAVDNGFEAYVNGTMVASRAVDDGDSIDWECSNLDLPYVGTDGWRTNGSCANIEFPVPASALERGQNTLRVLGVNAKNRQDIDDLEDGRNPGGLVYQLDVEYEPCSACTGTDLLAKYEWEAGFFMADTSNDGIEMTGTTLDEEGELTEVCFSTDYCGIDAVVKAGPEYEVYEDVTDEFCVTGIEGETPGGQTTTYAISNVRFYCDVPDDLRVGNSGRSADGDSDDAGESSGDGDHGHGNNEGDDPDNPGNDDGADDGNSGHDNAGATGGNGGGGGGRGRGS